MRRLRPSEGGRGALGLGEEAFEFDSLVSIGNEMYLPVPSQAYLSLPLLVQRVAEAQGDS